jgi:hypothetical protein
VFAKYIGSNLKNDEIRVFFERGDNNYEEILKNKKSSLPPLPSLCSPSGRR